MGKNIQTICDRLPEGNILSDLGGGFKEFLNFHLENWGHDPI